MTVHSFILACVVQHKNKLAPAHVAANVQAETFTKSAHGTSVHHTNVISPSHSDSLRLLQRHTLGKTDN